MQSFNSKICQKYETYNLPNSRIKNNIFINYPKKKKELSSKQNRACSWLFEYSICLLKRDYIWMCLICHSRLLLCINGLYMDVFNMP